MGHIGLQATFNGFLSSTYEYALPLLFGPIPPPPPSKSFKILCYNVCQGHRGHEVNHTLSDVSIVSSRLQELTTRFQAKHFFLDPDNPIRQLSSSLRESAPATK